MDLTELLHILWRRKLTVIVVAAVVIGIAGGMLQTLTPKYESSSTLVLSPTNPNTDLVFFGTLDAIVPVYAEAATSPTTRELAAVQSGQELSTISVQTFRGTPILKLKSRDADPRVAQASAQAVTDALLRRVEGGAVGIPSLTLTMIDSASLPTSPVFPRKRLSLIVAALLGFALGMGAAVLRETLTTKVATPEALARVAGLPVFGEIPPEPAVGRMDSPEDLVNNDHLRAVAEALRDLRTNLLFADGERRSVVVTSPEGSHGKTTVAAGLAATLARGGAKTLLVDGDLRRGRVAEMFRIERVPGMFEVLHGLPLQRAVRETSVPDLHILTGGRLGGDPGELLVTEFGPTLTKLEELYDVVVIDSTPLVPINDARIMARYAGSTILVASASTTTRRKLLKAMERLELISIRPAAAVLNNYKGATVSSYYYTAREPDKPAAKANGADARETRRRRRETRR